MGVCVGGTDGPRDFPPSLNYIKDRSIAYAAGQNKTNNGPLLWPTETRFIKMIDEDDSI